MGISEKLTQQEKVVIQELQQKCGELRSTFKKYEDMGLIELTQFEISYTSKQ